MKGWNPFGKIYMEIGSFLKKSPFNKEYGKSESGLSISEGNEKKEQKDNNEHGKCDKSWIKLRMYSLCTILGQLRIFFITIDHMILFPK